MTGAMCTTNYNEKRGCPGLYMDIDSLGGWDKGAEVITVDQPGDFYYMVFVHDHDHDHDLTTSHEAFLARSKAHVALYTGNGEAARFDVPTIDTSGDGRYDVTNRPDVAGAVLPVLRNSFSEN